MHFCRGAPRAACEFRRVGEEVNQKPQGWGGVRCTRYSTRGGALRYTVAGVADAEEAGLAGALAAGAEVAAAIQELLAHDGPAAAWERYALLAVGVEGVREVAWLAVHVEVLGVEARATLREGHAQHEPHLAEQPSRPHP